MKKVSIAIFTAFIGAGLMNAQDQRRANMIGGGGNNYGKCTIQVVVDGAAEVDIHGDTGALRDLQGQPPQWRSFQCTSPMPANAANVRFSAIEGRGRQELISDPRSGGTARVRIEDPESGESLYTFELTWGGYNQAPGDRNTGDQRGQYPGDRGDQYQRDNRDRDPNQDRRDNSERYGQDDRYRGGSPSDQAIQACQGRIREQAAERFHIRDLRFRTSDVQDNPGGQDMVKGIFEVRRDSGVDRFHYSCSMRLESGRIYSADIEPIRY